MTLPQTEIDNVIQVVLRNVIRCYNREQKSLVQVGKTAKNGGVIRAAARVLIEKVLEEIFSSINAAIPQAKIVSKIGTKDYLSICNIQYDGKSHSLNTIQVDRHVWSNEHRIAFVENKTYLDACFYERALADFKRIAFALRRQNVDPASVAYIVFAGQKGAGDATMDFYTAEFWNETKRLRPDPNQDDGIKPRPFFFLKGKRSSARPLYKVRHELDKTVIEEFVRLIISLIPEQTIQ